MQSEAISIGRGPNPPHPRHRADARSLHSLVDQDLPVRVSEHRVRGLQLGEARPRWKALTRLRGGDVLCCDG